MYNQPLSLSQRTIFVITPSLMTTRAHIKTFKARESTESYYCDVTHTQNYGFETFVLFQKTLHRMLVHTNINDTIGRNTAVHGFVHLPARLLRENIFSNI